MNKYRPLRPATLALLGTLGFLLVGVAPAADAAVPEGINYQAYLTNADGSPVDSTVTITFAAYNVDIGGVPLWNQTESINVNQGLFTTQLANPANPFPAGLFDAPVYIGLFIAGEELLPRRPLTSNAFSFKANDADTVDGADASDLDQSSEVSALQSDVSAVQGEVSTVQGVANSNESRISSLEASAGDITGVSAGAGLTGGGAAGNVALAIASNGITGAMIAPGQVGSSDLATGAVTSANIQDGAITTNDISDGTVAPADMNASGDFSLGGLTVGAAGLEVNSILDMIIRDDFHGLRWRREDNSAETGNIVIGETSMSMRHTGQNRLIFNSTAIGLGIAGGTPTAGFAATVPSLRVTGQTGIGHQIVTASYALDSTTDRCHTHGDLPCFYGSTTVACPVGTRILGGGSNGSAARFGSLSQSFPVGTSGWFCGSSYDLANSSDTCYAICARVQ